MSGEAMIERVAKGIFHADVGGADGNAWALTTEAARTSYRRRAQAAIEASDRAELLALLKRCRESGCINPFNENAQLAADIDAAL